MKQATFRLMAGILSVAGLAATLMPTAATAQTTDTAYPNQPLRFVVPYPPGGATDIIARVVQARLQVELGKPIVIDNRGGAGGSVGTEVAAKAPPDGYTVLFTLSSHTINPAIFPKLNFDTAKDFTPVALVASLPQILVTQPQFPANNLAELTVLVKSKPGQFQYGSVGIGSPGHLAGELYKQRTGADLTHVPYRGGGPAVTDVVGGQIPLLWVSLPAAAQFVKSGKLKALAVSTVKRSPLFPDVPTVQESGIADFEVDSWVAMFVPARTPQAIVDKLNKAVDGLLHEPDIREKLIAQGSEGVGGPPERLGKLVDAELVKWAKLAKDANIRAE